MGWDPIEGDWEQLSGQLKAKWNELADDDLTVIRSKLEQLTGLIQDRHGYAMDRAQRDRNDFSSAL